MNHLRQIVMTFLMACMLIFIFTSHAYALPRANTTIFSMFNQHIHVHPDSPSLPKSPFTLLSPPTACTRANDGEIWSDPATNEEWICTCFPRIDGNGNQQIVCAWALLMPQPNPSTWINLNSGMFMDVEGPSTNNGAHVHQWTYTGGNNQWWNMRISGYGNGTLNALSVYSNKCMGVIGGATNFGAQVVQWDCNGNPDQEWLWAWTGNYTSSGWPIWNIIDINSHLCLGIGGGSTQIGADVIQWGCNGNPDQSWY